MLFPFRQHPLLHPHLRLEDLPTQQQSVDMAGVTHNDGDSDNSSHGQNKDYSGEKHAGNAVHESNLASGEIEHDVASGHSRHRGLKSRQITMIAIGGAIGTGLIINTWVYSVYLE